MPGKQRRGRLTTQRVERVLSAPPRHVPPLLHTKHEKRPVTIVRRTSLPGLLTRLLLRRRMSPSKSTSSASSGRARSPAPSRLELTTASAQRPSATFGKLPPSHPPPHLFPWVEGHVYPCILSCAPFRNSELDPSIWQERMISAQASSPARSLPKTTRSRTPLLQRGTIPLPAPFVTIISRPIFPPGAHLITIMHARRGETMLHAAPHVHGSSSAADSTSAVHLLPPSLPPSFSRRNHRTWSHCTRPHWASQEHTFNKYKLGGKFIFGDRSLRNCKSSPKCVSSPHLTSTLSQPPSLPPLARKTPHHTLTSLHSTTPVGSLPLPSSPLRVPSRTSHAQSAPWAMAP